MQDNPLDIMEDMKMSMQMLPMIASAIRRLRMQKIMEEKQKVKSVPQETPKPVYQQNKWEISPSGGSGE